MTAEYDIRIKSNLKAGSGEVLDLIDPTAFTVSSLRPFAAPPRAQQ